MINWLKSKRRIIIAAVSIVIVLLTVSRTYAYLSTSTQTKENKFDYGIVNVTVKESFDDKTDIRKTDWVKKQVQVKNDSLSGVLKVAPIYVRVQLVSNWVDDESNVLAVDTESIVRYHLKENTGWEKGPDGYYYYTKVLEKDEVSPILLEGVSIGEEDRGQLPEKGRLVIYVLAEGIQSTHQAVEEAWGMSVGENEVLRIK